MTMGGKTPVVRLKHLLEREETSMTDLRKAAEIALEALEGIHVGNMTPMAEENWNKAIEALRQALAQPEQEPVTWRNAAIRLGEDLYSVGPDGYYDMTAEQWLDWALSVVTAPPSKPWVSLTGDEIDDLAAESGFGYINVARAIEAKLKERNNG